jgi:hypothetical protein
VAIALVASEPIIVSVNDVSEPAPIDRVYLVASLPGQDPVPCFEAVDSPSFEARAFRPSH